MNTSKKAVALLCGYFLLLQPALFVRLTERMIWSTPLAAVGGSAQWVLRKCAERAAEALIAWLPLS